MHTITDNWLFEDAGYLLSGTFQEGRPGRLFDLHRSEIVETPVRRDAIQLLSLVALLEHVVLCDDIGVLDTPHDGWKTFDCFQGLLESGLISSHSRTAATETLLLPYRAEWVRHDAIYADWSRPPGSFFSRVVVDGSASYVSFAQVTARPYCPHPVRGHFLSQTLWHNSWPPTAVRKMETVIASTRVRLRRHVGGGSTLSTLSCHVPSTALVCLREASISTASDALSVALQLRDMPGMSALRSELSGMEAGLRTLVPGAAVARAASRLDAAAAEVERRLGLRTVGPDAPRTINVFDLPLPIPAFLHAPVISPRHTGILQHLVLRGVDDVEQILASSLGLRDPGLLPALDEIGARFRALAT